jgi:hypothetical protein
MTELGLNSTLDVEEKYQGVQGWLILFCLVLTVIAPCSCLFHLAHTLPLLMRTHDPRRQILWTVFVVMYLAIAGVAFVTGIRLWLVRRGAVRMAKLWLLMNLCLNVSYFFLWLILFSHTRTDSVAKVAWDHIVGPLVPFFLWNTYLEHSKRVRDTYREVDRPA